MMRLRRRARIEPGGPFRGGKYSSFEAGTRVPWIVRWPRRLSPGVSAALVCQVDLLASFAALTGQTLTAADGPDSMDVSAALLGVSTTGRAELVQEAGALALRQGPWKYIEPNNKQKVAADTRIELGNDSVAQLYNLTDDPGETRNLAPQQPDRAKAMADALTKIKQAGRSR